MSDTDYSGASGASESGSTDSPSGHSAGAEQAIKSVKDTAYDAIVRSETLSTDDYVDETRDREAEDRGETLPPHRLKQRSERIQRALEEASREAPSNDHREAPEARQEASPDWESQLRARDESVRAGAHFELREAEFAKSNPYYYETKQAVLGAYPPAAHIADAIVKSPVGPQLALAFANSIDAIEYINSLPPAQALRELAQTEGRMMAQLEMQGQQQQPTRRVTQAKAPIRPLNGGAGPSTSWSDSDNMDTFARGLNKDLASRRGRR